MRPMYVTSVDSGHTSIMIYLGFSYFEFKIRLIRLGISFPK